MLSFESMNIKVISENKKFWKAIKSHLRDKRLNSNKLILIKKVKLVSEEPELATIMNKYFTNITKNYKLKRSPHFCGLNHILIYFQNHTSIIKTASLANPKNDSVSEIIELKPVTLDEVRKEI